MNNNNTTTTTTTKRLGDHTGTSFCTLFNQEGVAVLGTTADAIHQMRAKVGEVDDTGSVEDLFNEVSFTEHLVTLKLKFEEVKGEQRLKTTVVKVRPLEGETLVRENKALLAAIKEYMS